MFAIPKWFVDYTTCARNRTIQSVVCMCRRCCRRRCRQNEFKQKQDFSFFRVFSGAFEMRAGEKLSIWACKKSKQNTFHCHTRTRRKQNQFFLDLCTFVIFFHSLRSHYNILLLLLLILVLCAWFKVFFFSSVTSGLNTSHVKCGNGFSRNRKAFFFAFFCPIYRNCHQFSVSRLYITIFRLFDINDNDDDDDDDESFAPD